MSIGGGSQKSSQKSSQESEAINYGSDVWGGQVPFLQDLYAKGQATQAGGSFPYDVGAHMYLNSAGGMSGKAESAIGQSNAYLQQFANPGTNPALQAYATNLGQQFNEQFLPGLKGEAALAGGLGGSRQQIGSALGAQRAMQTLGDFTAQTYSDDQNRRLAAAQSIGQNAQLLQQGAAQQLQNADFLRSIPWYGLTQYQGLLGNPITLSKGGVQHMKSSGSGSGSGWNANFSLGSG